MSTTTEAIEIVEELVEANIPKTTAKKLIDYADKQGSNRTEITWLWRIMVGGFMIVFTLLGILYSEIKSTRQELREDIGKLEGKLEGKIDENRKLLIQLIRKK